MMIRTPSLLLRRFSVEDVAKVFLMSREPGLQEWIPDQVYEDEQQAAKVLRYLIEKYEDPGDPRLAALVVGICLQATSELIGHVGLSPLQGEVEIGYAIEASHQGRGFASEAVAAMCAFGLEGLGLARILGIVHKDNIASCRVLEKAGLVLVREEAGTLHGRGGFVRRYEKARPSCGGR
ncbi:MAG: GNAT family N-acetyltransferase [Deltaproteobacteria bacterium]|nr:GNAT family N-acetyltransferase [Deltaproteobacteria bacterium]